MAGGLSVIEAQRLSKYYGQKAAVKNLDLHVHRGDVFGFLGPNGAGKSTTIRMLTTVIRPTSGTARINGFDIRRQPLAVRRQIAVIPQISTLGAHLDVYQNIMIYLLFRGFGYREARKRTDEAIERFGLGAVAGLRPHQLSGGYRRRVQVARALLSGASVLFLDEPSVGLDPVVRQETCVFDNLKGSHSGAI
nr:ABC transporter ATP-binding protein [Symbiobacterium terraclitae]